jgi:hypothetical protein
MTAKRDRERSLTLILSRVRLRRLGQTTLYIIHVVYHLRSKHPYAKSEICQSEKCGCAITEGTYVELESRRFNRLMSTE